MSLLKIFKRKYLSIFIISISVLLFLSCNFSKKTDSHFVVPDIESEDREIAAFLVNTTETNSVIVELYKISQSSSKAIDVKDIFSEQIKLTSEIQSRIKQISEERFVTIPLTYKNTKIKYSNDVELLDLLINQLVVQINLFEKIDKTNDAKILELKNEFLPKLNFQSQKVSTLRVKKIVTK